jgi:hypothetical protein
MVIGKQTDKHGRNVGSRARSGTSTRERCTASCTCLRARRSPSTSCSVRRTCLARSASVRASPSACASSRRGSVEPSTRRRADRLGCDAHASRRLPAELRRRRGSASVRTQALARANASASASGAAARAHGRAHSNYGTTKAFAADIAARPGSGDAASSPTFVGRAAPLSSPRLARRAPQVGPLLGRWVLGGQGLLRVLPQALAHGAASTPHRALHRSQAQPQAVLRPPPRGVHVHRRRGRYNSIV